MSDLMKYEDAVSKFDPVLGMEVHELFTGRTQHSGNPSFSGIAWIFAGNQPARS